MFGGSKKTYVGTTVARAIEDDDLPDSIKQALVQALHNDGEVLEHITDHLTQSIGIRAEKMYRYGEDRYVFGNPSGEFVSANVAPRVIEEILRRETGDPFISVNYSRFGQLNLYHLAWKRMVEEFQYNAEDNTVHATYPTNFPIVLEDLKVYVSKTEVEKGYITEEAMEIWERSPQGRNTELGNLGRISLGSPQLRPLFRWDQNANEGIWASYTWTLKIPYDFEPGDEGPPKIPDEVLRVVNFQLHDYDYEGEYFHAKYTRDGKEHFWYYKLGAGTYPELDHYFESGDHAKLFGEFYPNGYFRVERRSLAEDTSSEEYKSSKKLLSYLRMDYDTLVEAVHENPDIDDVEQAFVTFGIPAVSDSPMENRYLFEFFDKLYYYQDNRYQRPAEAAQAIFSSWLTANDINMANAIIIQDRKFKMALQNRGIYKQRRAGTIGPIGTHTSEFAQSMIQVEGINAETNRPEMVPQRLVEHIYRKQIGTGIFEEVRVMQLAMRYFVWGEYNTVGDEEDEILLVPLEKSIMETYNVPDREELFSRALHYVFNSRVTVTSKWYQSGFFQFVITVVGIVVSVVTMNPAVWGAMAAGFITGIVALGKLLLKGLVLSLIFKLVVDVVGIDVAIFLAVVAAATGIYKGGLSESASPLASNLLGAANGLLNAVGESIADAIRLIQEEMTDFLAESHEQMKLLEEANDLLKPSSILSPFVYLGESAEAFYNRTIRSGNVGVMAIDAQSMFVDQALRLPTLHDTLGGTYYAA